MVDLSSMVYNSGTRMLQNDVGAHMGHHAGGAAPRIAHWSVVDGYPEAALEKQKDINEFRASSIVWWGLVTLHPL